MSNQKSVLLTSALIIAGGSYVWSWVVKSPGESMTWKDFVLLLPVVQTLIGLNKERKKQKARPFRLTASFDNGLYGGLIGGGLAGLIIGLVYYAEARTAGMSIIPFIILYSLFSGMVLGASSQFFILWFRHLAKEKKESELFFNELTGGLLGGVIGGVSIGALCGFLFGMRPTQFVDVAALAIAAALGAFCITLGALFYNYGGRWQNPLRALVRAIPITGLLVVLGIILLQVLDIEGRYFPKERTQSSVTLGGAIMGALFGALLGLQIGLTLWLYRLREEPPEPNKKKRLSAE
ncbi:MAG TPA: hypothetical protein VGC66_03135 [Pyrinomonadaceae bacterium]